LTEIDLKTESISSLAAFYAEGNICACFYDANSIPHDAELETDLREILKFYEMLSYNETVPVSTSDREEDEDGRRLIEDLRKLRQHKRIDRNSKLAKEAKRIHGTVCKVCGFDFEDTYGEIGKGFIEAHHLQPLGNLKNERLLLSPKDDFTVLCSNCHRMIHRFDKPHAIKKFKESIFGGD
jgi:5-methylcytosine-specific restriction protein A